MPPDPIVPLDLDLRDFRWMKLDLIALFNSDFNSTADDTAWRAGVTLWGKAWHQVPAGSLPDDDARLCNLAGLGRDMKTWRRVKHEALHGFDRCSDGRLYHRFLCGMAVEAADERDRYARRREADRTRKTARLSVGIPPDERDTEPPIPQENPEIPAEKTAIPAEFHPENPIEGAKRPESKVKIKNLSGNLGRFAPCARDPAAEPDKATVDETVGRAVAALKGEVSKGIRDQEAYQAAVKENKFRQLVASINAWVGHGLDGQERMAAWELLADVEKAGERAHMTAKTRKAFDRLVALSRANGLANGADPDAAIPAGRTA